MLKGIPKKLSLEIRWKFPKALSKESSKNFNREYEYQNNYQFAKMDDWFKIAEGILKEFILSKGSAIGITKEITKHIA